MGSVHLDSLYSRAVYMLYGLSTVYTGVVSTLECYIRYMAFPLGILVQGVHWGGRNDNWPIHFVCRGIVYTGAVGMMWLY